MHLQSFPPLYEIEISSGLCVKGSATCLVLREEGRQTQDEKDAPVLPQCLLHNPNRHAQLRLHISQERRLRLLRKKRIDLLAQLKGQGV